MMSSVSVPGPTWRRTLVRICVLFTAATVVSSGYALAVGRVSDTHVHLLLRVGFVAVGIAAFDLHDLLRRRYVHANGWALAATVYAAAVAVIMAGMWAWGAAGGDLHPDALRDGFLNFTGVGVVVAGVFALVDRVRGRTAPRRPPTPTRAAASAPTRTAGSTGPRPRTGPTRVLVGLLLFVAFGALGGGVAMLLDPTGRLVGLHPSMLATTPLSSFLWPGILLTVGLGAAPLVVAVGIARGRPATGSSVLERRTGERWTWTASVAVGVVLLGWIGVQVALIEFSALQPLMFVTGAALVALPFSRAVRHDLGTGVGRASRGGRP